MALNVTDCSDVYTYWTNFYLSLYLYIFSAWGENIVLMHMNVVLVCLLLRYSDKSKTSITFMTGYIMFMLLLLWPTVSPQLVWILYFCSVPAIGFSRVSIFIN